MSAPAARAAACWWRKLLLLGMSCAITALLLELVLAALDLFPPFPRWQPREDAGPNRTQNLIVDDALGWRLRPSSTFTLETEGVAVAYVADENGFRVDELGPVEPAGPRRIAFVGDSFTYGVGVAYRDTFAARTAAALGAVPLNRGMPAYGVDQMWLMLREVVLAEKPDLVVVAMIDDDFERTLHVDSARLCISLPKRVYKVDGGRLLPEGPADRPGALLCLADGHSRLLSAWRSLERCLGRRWPVGEWWEINAACIDAMIEDARAAGVPLLFAHIRSNQSWSPMRTLETHLTARGAAYVDIGARWNCSPAKGYFPHDGHYNREGHRAAAETLARVIAERWPHLAGPPDSPPSYAATRATAGPR